MPRCTQAVQATMWWPTTVVMCQVYFNIRTQKQEKFSLKDVLMKNMLSGDGGNGGGRLGLRQQGLSGWSRGGIAEGGRRWWRHADGWR